MSDEEKLKKAIEYLGDKYILHPKYSRNLNPAHGYYGSYFLKTWLESKRRG